MRINMICSKDSNYNKILFSIFAKLVSNMHAVINIYRNRYEFTFLMKIINNDSTSIFFSTYIFIKHLFRIL